MAIIKSLYPPIVETYLQAFSYLMKVGENEYISPIKIYFNKSDFNDWSQISHIQISIYDSVKNISIVNNDAGIIYIPLNGEPQYDADKNMYYVEVTEDQLDINNYTPDRVYKIQVRLGEKDVVYNVESERTRYTTMLNKIEAAYTKEDAKYNTVNLDEMNITRDTLGLQKELPKELTGDLTKKPFFSETNGQGSTVDTNAIINADEVYFKRFLYENYRNKQMSLNDLNVMNYLFGYENYTVDKSGKITLNTYTSEPYGGNETLKKEDTEAFYMYANDKYIAYKKGKVVILTSNTSAETFYYVGAESDGSYKIHSYQVGVGINESSGILYVDTINDQIVEIADYLIDKDGYMYTIENGDKKYKFITDNEDLNVNTLSFLYKNDKANNEYTYSNDAEKKFNNIGIIDLANIEKLMCQNYLQLSQNYLSHILEKESGLLYAQTTGQTVTTVANRLSDIENKYYNETYNISGEPILNFLADTEIKVKDNIDIASAAIQFSGFDPVNENIYYANLSFLNDAIKTINDRINQIDETSKYKQDIDQIKTDYENKTQGFKNDIRSLLSDAPTATINNSYLKLVREKNKEIAKKIAIYNNIESQYWGGAVLPTGKENKDNAYVFDYNGNLVVSADDYCANGISADENGNVSIVLDETANKKVKVNKEAQGNRFLRLEQTSLIKDYVNTGKTVEEKIYSSFGSFDDVPWCADAVINNDAKLQETKEKKFLEDQLNSGKRTGFAVNTEEGTKYYYGWYFNKYDTNLRRVDIEAAIKDAEAARQNYLANRTPENYNAYEAAAHKVFNADDDSFIGTAYNYLVDEAKNDTKDTVKLSNVKQLAQNIGKLVSAQAKVNISQYITGYSLEKDADLNQVRNSRYVFADDEEKNKTKYLIDKDYTSNVEAKNTKNKFTKPYQEMFTINGKTSYKLTSVGAGTPYNTYSVQYDNTYKQYQNAIRNAKKAIDNAISAKENAIKNSKVKKDYDTALEGLNNAKLDYESSIKRVRSLNQESYMYSDSEGNKYNLLDKLDELQLLLSKLNNLLSSLKNDSIDSINQTIILKNDVFSEHHKNVYNYHAIEQKNILNELNIYNKGNITTILTYNGNGIAKIQSTGNPNKPSEYEKYLDTLKNARIDLLKKYMAKLEALETLIANSHREEILLAENYVTSSNLPDFDAYANAIQNQITTVITINDNTPTSDWYAYYLNYFSEWSTVCLMKPITKPVIDILNFANLSFLNINTKVDTIGFNDLTLVFRGVYEQININPNGTEEKLKSYTFTIRDEDGTIIDNGVYSDYTTYSKEKINIVFNTKNCVFIEGAKYNVTLTCQTENYYTDSVNYDFIIANKTGADLQGITITMYGDDDEGRVCFVINAEDTDNSFSHYIIQRATEKNGYKTWEDVLKFEHVQKVDNLILNDYSIESDVKYKYRMINQELNIIHNIQVKNPDLHIHTHSDIVNEEKEPVYDVKVSFYYSYLVSNNKQLNIKFDNKISSFKYVTSETKFEPLDSVFPFITKNGRLLYRSFPMSCTISMNLDDKELFMKKNTSDIDNYAKERLFRELVFEFLHKNKYFLFKSPTEGNIIVKLMDINFTPNETLDRLIYTLNCNALECYEYNSKNIIELGIQTLDGGNDEKFIPKQRQNYLTGSLENINTISLQDILANDKNIVLMDNQYCVKINEDTYYKIVDVNNLSLVIYPDTSVSSPYVELVHNNEVIYKSITGYDENDNPIIVININNFSLEDNLMIYDYNMKQLNYNFDYVYETYYTDNRQKEFVEVVTKRKIQVQNFVGDFNDLVEYIKGKYEITNRNAGFMVETTIAQDDIYNVEVLLLQDYINGEQTIKANLYDFDAFINNIPNGRITDDMYVTVYAVINEEKIFKR